MPQSLAELRRAPHTSISQLKTYLQCPRKYFFHYIEKAEPAFRPLALSFGHSFHAAVQHHLVRSSQEQPVPREELHEVFRDALEQATKADGPPLLFEDEEQDLGSVIDAGIRMLDAFVEKVPLPEKVLGIEVPLSLELMDPLTGEVLDRPLVGAIDAVVLENGKPVIWELKTGKRRWGPDQLEFDPQPTAYRMGARRYGLNTPEVKLLVTTKTKKPDVQIEHLVRHPGDEQELTELALSVHRAVDVGIDHRVRGWQCRSCQYAGACAP